MDPLTVVTEGAKFLTDSERLEVADYSDIYYYGQKAHGRKIDTDKFDDPEGYYQIVLNDHVGYRYEILESIGIGGCGQVVKAYDHKEHKMVALKIVRNVPIYQDLADEEIRISELLSKKDASNTLGVVHILHHFFFRGHTIMVFELLGLNLFQVLKSNKFQGFKETIVRDFAQEILECLDKLHTINIVHCDIKPENIMTHSRTSSVRSKESQAKFAAVALSKLHEEDLIAVDKNQSPPESGDEDPNYARGMSSDSGFADMLAGEDAPSVEDRTHWKLIDFGCSTFADFCRLPYIQSRYYRAPEVILGKEYGLPVDMWSFGCVIAELLTGRPLLQGENEYDQFSVIVELIGSPTRAALVGARRAPYFLTPEGHPRYCVTTQDAATGDVTLDGSRTRQGTWRGPPGSRSLKSVLRASQPDIPESLLDFLQKCLCWDPDKRMTPAQAINHPWVGKAFRKRSMTT